MSVDSIAPCGIRIFEENNRWYVEQCGFRYPAPFPLTDRLDDFAEYEGIVSAYSHEWITTIAPEVAHLNPLIDVPACCTRGARIREIVGELWVDSIERVESIK